ncbi:MucR family transcriptional regulator [Pacificispira sp.]|uniref:MucR family transcriptional regulator n=1 Tax=Pacificispira sp. TaxID=2888761 RepID=UPI003B51D484
MKDTDNSSVSSSDLLQLTSNIICAHVSNNSVPTTELSALIDQVYRTLEHIGATQEQESVGPIPAVPVKKSVHADYLICLEDGKKLKMLKRHLRTAFDMTPEQYRERWGLPPDYPMTAPNYSKQRSRFARESGLGQRS